MCARFHISRASSREAENAFLGTDGYVRTLVLDVHTTFKGKRKRTIRGQDGGERRGIQPGKMRATVGFQ